MLLLNYNDIYFLNDKAAGALSYSNEGIFLQYIISKNNF